LFVNFLYLGKTFNQKNSSMKNSVWLIPLGAVLISLVFLSFKTHAPERTVFLQDASNQLEIPQNVQVILDKSCLPCHGADGSGKAKMKWNYEKMGDYTTSKLVGKLVKINEVVSEEEMPPPKKIKKNPELKLTSEERDIIAKWADEAAQSLAGGSD
jgi:uncharacterized membrane protein